jgi:hypothetical protein
VIVSVSLALWAPVPSTKATWQLLLRSWLSLFWVTL